MGDAKLALNVTFGLRKSLRVTSSYGPPAVGGERLGLRMAGPGLVSASPTCSTSGVVVVGLVAITSAGHSWSGVALYCASGSAQSWFL